MSHQTRSNVNMRDNVRPGTARPFGDERTSRNLAIGSNITSISSFNQTPLVTTTITTKHYPTEAELKTNRPKIIDVQRKEEYQKLVEKQQDLMKRKDQQQHHYHHQQLQRQQLHDHEFGIQLKRNQHDEDQKHQFGVRLTGVYPPEYFENNYDDDDDDDVDGDDEVEYYLPPPPLEFSSSPHLKADEIVAIPPPEHYNHSHLIPSHHLKPQGALKKDNTNLKLFVTTATFSPAKSSTRMNHSGANVHHDGAKRFIDKEPITVSSSGNNLPRYNRVGLSEGCMKSDKNQIDRAASTSNKIISDSLENQKQIRSETSDTSKLKSSNDVSSKQLLTKEDKSIERIGSTSNQSELSQPPVLIRRPAEKKGHSSQKCSDATQEVTKGKTEQKENLKEGVSVEETSGQDKQSNGFEQNRETADRNISPSPHELSTSSPFRRSIEIRTETTSDFPLKKSNSIKYKIDAKPPTHSKSSVEKAATPQGSLLPTPELKVEYVSKSPRTSCSDVPSESPNEKSKSRSFFSTAWKKNASARSEEKQQNEVKKSSIKLSNTQKFLNLLNVKNSPNLPFKSHKNKAEENKGRKERKKSLDLIDKKKPLYHSTPPPRMRLQSGLEQEEGKTPSSIKATPNAGQTFKKGGKQGAELMAVETDADGVPTKHLILSPSKYPQSNDGSRASSPRHSRQNSDGSAVFTTDLTTSNKSEQIPLQHFVIVAIDFGTTFSGYAFCFVRDPDSVHIMRRWEGGDPGLVNQKTLTTLLLDPQGNFHSFGFTARDTYHDLDEEQARKWFYFEKFKMTLHHNAELNKDTTIKASNGKPFPALKVFSYALKYFKDHALQELTDQSETNIYNEDIRWVITVPAIWKAPAKQFMRQAAYQAGIATPENPSQLMIALEPEAASIYVRKLRIYQLVPESSTLLSTSTISTDTTPRRKGQNGAVSKGNFFSDLKYQTLPTSSKEKEFMSPSSSMATVGQEVDVDGTRYMVVDCGGGTVDITVHEMEANGGSLKELHKATGGPYGSIGIDHEFEKLLVRIFGPEFIDSFKLKRPSGWIDLMTAFESRKRSAHPGKENSLNVALPFSLIEFYKKNKGSSVESAIKKFGNKEITWSSQGMLRLTPSAMKKLFQPTIDNIVKAVGDVLNYTSARGVKYLFLVGGFAESGILQSEIKREFGHLLKIVIPQDVGTTILKGAVCFGLDPTVVSERRCRMTYGVGVLNKFVDGVHPPAKLVLKDGIRWCVDVLDKFVVADQPVSLGDSVVRSYAPARAGQRSSVIHIYCSERADATFVTDAGVKRCGTLCLDSSDPHYRHTMSGTPLIKSRRSREIQARMTFGDTEIKVSAVDVATGKCVKSTIDFLGR